jgi:transposase-like protein
MAEHRRKTDRLKEAAIVHEMRVSGISYSRIARTLGLSPKGAADTHQEYLEYLRELESLGSVEANRRVQDERYETLLSVLWTQALSGDLASVRECRAILDSISAREARITAMVTDEGQGKRVTLIAEGADDAYIRALQEMTK